MKQLFKILIPIFLLLLLGYTGYHIWNQQKEVEEAEKLVRQYREKIADTKMRKDSLTKEQNRFKDHNNILRDSIKILQQQVATLRKQLREKVKTISKNEAHINSMRNKMAVLENEIYNLRNSTTKMNINLLKQLENKRFSLDKQIGELFMKNRELEDENNQLVVQLVEKEKKRDAVKGELDKTENELAGATGEFYSYENGESYKNGGFYEDGDLDNLNFKEFTLPAPPYSDRLTFEINDVFSNALTFGEIDEQLSEMLLQAGFKDNNNRRFYYFQLKEQKSRKFKGFAVVTQFEQITKNGEPLADRFSETVEKKEPTSFLEWLVPPLNQGYFRCFAFLIAQDYYGGESNIVYTRREAAEEYERGEKELPDIIASQLVARSCKLQVLVYEYKQREDKKDGYKTDLENLSADVHLEKAFIRF